MLLVGYVVGFMKLFALLLSLCACAPLAPIAKPAPGVTQEQAWNNARHAEANVNGCVDECPGTANRCVDDCGICWSRCAWDMAGKDKDFREMLSRAAHNADPTSSYLVDCPKVPGAQEI